MPIVWKHPYQAAEWTPGTEEGDKDEGRCTWGNWKQI